MYNLEGIFLFTGIVFIFPLAGRTNVMNFLGNYLQIKLSSSRKLPIGRRFSLSYLSAGGSQVCATIGLTYICTLVEYAGKTMHSMFCWKISSGYQLGFTVHNRLTDQRDPLREVSGRGQQGRKKGANECSGFLTS